jgi:4-amino-4-deoxy-L-arabinose transferase-like glycosyltransferase
LRKRLWLELVLILALTTLAFAVRVYRLPDIPPGLHSDEAANGVDVLDILSGHNSIFFERNSGREPLYIYLQAVAVGLLGTTSLALRLTSAIIGALTIPAIYWMVREAFANDREDVHTLALWTAGFAAFAYWHLSFSRLGYRAIMLPLLASVTFALFWRAWRQLQDGKRFPLTSSVLCGLSLGLSLYTYMAARLLPVLFAVVVIAALVQAHAQRSMRRQMLLAVIVMVVVAFGIALPLGFYFLSHPSSFLSHFVGTSLFLDPTYADNSPLTRLVLNALKTIGMFGLVSDNNLRYNPAERPALDPILSIWLLAGIVLAVSRWRRLPYGFALAWLAIFGLAGLFSDTAPNSLRMLGALPIVCLLPVLAMLECGRRLANRRPWLATWLPLPFLLVSGLFGLRSYFSIWTNNYPLEYAFDTRPIQAFAVMSQHMSEQDVWILPVWPVFSVPLPEYALDFLSRRQLAYGTVTAKATEGPEELQRVTGGKRYAHLLNWIGATLEPDGGYALTDAKQLLSFLLNKHGQYVAEHSLGNTAYTTYELPASPEYRVANDEIPADISFGGKLKLTGLAYGHTATSPEEPATVLDEKRVPSGHNAWAVLRWQAQQPTENNLKTSLYLVDESGHLAGQVDNLLLSDLYLYKQNWEPGEQGSTYHILPTLQGVSPGRYKLFLAVYDPKTMQRLPVLDANGNSAGSAAMLGFMDIAPPLAPAQVQPSSPLPPNTRLGPDLALLGYDLPIRALNPGDRLPLTLFWRAENKPGADYFAKVELQDAQGQPVVQRKLRPGNDSYPTTEWPAGEVLRNWHDLTVPPTTPAGSYQLLVSLHAADQELGRVSLGDVEVRGRPRNFVSPAIQNPAAYRLGNDIAFLGSDLEEVVVRSGDTLNLTLFWQALSQVDRFYTVFVHLLGADGQVVAQQDSPPGGGASPTSSWVPGEYVTDTYQLVVKPDISAGEYRVEIGMYDPATGVRLLVLDAEGRPQADRVLLSQPVQIRMD